MYFVLVLRGCVYIYMMLKESIFCICNVEFYGFPHLQRDDVIVLFMHWLGF